VNFARTSRFVAVGLTGVALLVAGCGDDDSDGASTTAATAADTSAATTPAQDDTAAVRPIRNPYRKPALPAHPGERLDTLVVRDVRVGDGEAIESGDTIIADYRGGLYANGREFDSSWQRGREPLEIRIDNGGVIAGWWQGLQGMRVGGRRTLAIPAALGYGEAGSGEAIPPNSDLYFVVDLLAVRKAEPTGPDAGGVPAG
jgi:FKBP-type peptidyl-prolyl cis-trans isomerase